MAFIERIKDTLEDEKYVVFNVIMHVPIMFHTNYIAYNHIPTLEEIATIKKQSYKIAVQDNGQLPDYIYNDDSIVKLK